MWKIPRFGTTWGEASRWAATRRMDLEFEGSGFRVFRGTKMRDVTLLGVFPESQYMVQCD